MYLIFTNATIDFGWEKKPIHILHRDLIVTHDVE